MKKYSILFVCLGNICRSPAAEGIMLKKLKEAHLEGVTQIDSAGTSNYNLGQLPDARMRRHAARRGYLLESRARAVRHPDFDDFDLLVAMDDSNYHHLKRMAGTLEQEKKVVRMTDFAEKLLHDHVPDPYYEGGDGFELVLNILEDACSGLLKQVQQECGKQ